MPLKDLSDLFLPYQKAWLQDDSRYKLAEKSRRTGFTWCEAFKSVEQALTFKVRNKPMNTWFTSSNFDNAKEFILYCKEWATLLNAGFEDTGLEIINIEKDIKTQSLTFKNGARITALSSNPTVLRGKGGKLIIDEFAFHQNQRELWKAAKPVVTWGYPLVLISSLNGKEMFYKLCELVRQGKLDWSLHTIDIFKAVNEGLIDKILDKKATNKEKEAWIEQERQGCVDDITWQQEYCCIAVDEATSFISYDLMGSCTENTIMENLNTLKGDIYVGYDVARVKDLSVIAVSEKLGSILYLRKLYELKNVTFKEQKAIVASILKLPNARRLAIDETGIGKQTAEELKHKFGARMVEPINFSLKTKEELAFNLLYAFQDHNIRIPDNEKLKNDIHSIKRMPTSAGVIRFDCERSETDGHADRFWALALCYFASLTAKGKTGKVKSFMPRRNKNLKFEFDYKASNFYF